MNKRKHTYAGGGQYVPEYFLGGALKKLLPAAAGAATSFIPGVGPALAPVASQAVGMLTEEKQQQPKQPVEIASSSLGRAHGGMINPLGQNALAFTGPSHANGGIQLPNAEVEGGETMDFVEFRNGGKMVKKDTGEPYVFSKRLNVPGTNTSFADYHKQLVKRNANEQQIKQLALAQEQVAGRQQGTGAQIPALPKTETPPQEVSGEKAYGRRRKMEDGGYYAVKASETEGDEGKYPINSADDVRDAWKLRGHGDYNISQEKLEERIKRKAREYDVDLNTDEKAQGGKVEMQTGGVPPTIPPSYPFFVDPFGGVSKNPGAFNFKQLPGSGRSVPSIRAPRGLPSRGLNTVTKNMIPGQLGAIALGTYLGYEGGNVIGKAMTGKDLPAAYSEWSENVDNLAEATDRAESRKKDLEEARAYYSMFPQGILGPSSLSGLDEGQPDYQHGPEGLIVKDAPTQSPQTGGEETQAPQTSPTGTQSLSQEPSVPLPSAQSQQFTDASGIERVTDIPTPSLNEDFGGEQELNIDPGAMQAAGTPETPAQSGMSEGMQSALQFVPEAMNFLTGAFGKADTPEPTRVSNRALGEMRTNVNVDPQLARNAASYRAILSDPNATMTQKLAAQAQKQQADNQILSDKINRENQLRTNKAKLQANLDRANAQFANQARTERMKGDAMFGPTGNIARGALASASQKMLMQQAQKGQERRDRQSTMAILSQLDPALQEKYAKQIGLFE